jgi:hypothetical protein
LVAGAVDLVQPQLKLADRVVVVEQSEVLETIPELLEPLDKEIRVVAVEQIAALIDMAAVVAELVRLE